MRKLEKERQKHDNVELFGAMTLLAGTIKAFDTGDTVINNIPGGRLFIEILTEAQKELNAEITKNMLDTLREIKQAVEEEEVDEER